MTACLFFLDPLGLALLSVHKLRWQTEKIEHIFFFFFCFFSFFQLEEEEEAREERNGIWIIVD